MQYVRKKLSFHSKVAFFLVGGGGVWLTRTRTRCTKCMGPNVHEGNGHGDPTWRMVKHRTLSLVLVTTTTNATLPLLFCFRST